MLEPAVSTLVDPLVFEPYYRPQVWGGRRLHERLGKPLPEDGSFGEAWEISAHPHHVSRVAHGALSGTGLTELWERFPDSLWGTAPRPDKFPWLIKFLDCHEQLSVQVHPDDNVARQILGDELGKTEAWVVVDVEPSACIYAGLKAGVTRADLEHRLNDGTVAGCLHSFTPKVGECIYLPAGTVHAVGGGIVIAEVQQTSDATFRLFDWNRVGGDGQPRPLHREESLAAIDFSAGPVAPCVGTPISPLPPDVFGETLVRSPYFVIDRFQLQGDLPLPYQGQMCAWMVLTGRLELSSRETGYKRSFTRGDTILVPASATPLTWRITPDSLATVLAVRLP